MSMINLINLEDLENIRFGVFARNETSDKVIINSSDVRISSLESNSVTLVVPKTFCTVSQVISLHVYKAPFKRKIKTITRSSKIKGCIEVVGVVESKEDDEENLNSYITDDHTSYVTIRFTRYDEVQWQIVCKAYSNCQDKILKYLEMAVGE